MFNNEGLDTDPSTKKADTVIGHSVKVDGTLNSEGNILIEGEFKGTLDVVSKLTVGKDAVVEAQVTAKEAFIAGKIIGNINVSDKLELSNSAKVDGDIKAGILVIEAGAFMNGQCTMGSIKQAPIKSSIGSEGQSHRERSGDNKNIESQINGIRDKK